MTRRKISGSMGQEGYPDGLGEVLCPLRQRVHDVCFLSNAVIVRIAAMALVVLVEAEHGAVAIPLLERARLLGDAAVVVDDEAVLRAVVDDPAAGVVVKVHRKRTAMALFPDEVVAIGVVQEIAVGLGLFQRYAVQEELAVDAEE